MKYKKDILFLIEHDDRESEVVHRISNILREEHGFDVSILSILYHSHLFRKIKPKVVVVPYALSANDWPISYFVKKFGSQINYINLNWEQHLAKMTKEYKAPRDTFCKKQIMHLAWSDNFKAFLAGHGVLEKNIEIIPNPTYQLLHEKCLQSDILRKELSCKFNIVIDKAWLFLPMNYGWAFSSNSEIEAKINKGFPEEYAWNYRDYSQKCIKEFVKFAYEISKSDEYEIIIRPHPSISCDQYLELFADEIGVIPSSIKFSKEYSIREWISASDIVGSSWSTSVWDAVNVGKLGFLFTPYERPESHEVWWNVLVPNINKAEDVSFLLNKKSNNSIVDTISSINTIALWIVDVLLSSNASEIQNQKIENNLSHLRSILYMLRSQVRSILAKNFNGIGIKKGMLRDYFDYSDLR